MRVVVDDREPEDGPLRYLRTMDDVVVTVGRLEVGDYCIDDRFVVERKTFSDFSASVCDGRFFRQACRLASSPQRSVLILEGSSAGRSALSREALQGALITLSVVLGVPLLRALDGEESARLMCYVSRQLSRHIRGAVSRHGYRPKGKRKQQLHILQGLPGIGPTRAERLLKAFGSVADVFAATEEELAAVDGFGNTTATRIAATIHEARAVYHVQ
jgi:DNA excision repair protein ERCC-4